MLEMAKFNLNVIIKRKSLTRLFFLIPVIAFILTLLFYRSIRDLEMIGNPVYSFFFFNGRQNSLVNILLITLPLICSLFYGDYYYYEKTFLHEILTRGKKKSHYFLTNALFAFLTGFLIVALFIGSMFLFNFIITNNPEHTFSYFSMEINENDPSNTNWWLHQLFYEQPYIYIAIRSLTISLFAGFLSLTTYCVSLFVKAKILAYMSTMIITLVISMIGFIIPVLGNWASTVSFKPGITVVYLHGTAILFWYVLLASISCILISLKCRKEVLE